MKETIKKSGKYQFLEVGEGKSIVILHGLMGGLSNFQGVTDYFPSKGYKVLIPMLPIYDLPLLKTNVKEFAKYVHQFILHLGLTDVTLLGNSLGGHIGLLVSLLYPKNIRGLIITGSSGLYENSMGESYPKREDKEYMRKKCEEVFYDPEIAPGQKQKWYPWPYQEGITIEEAKNELSFLATGIYGKKLPNQNGAPLRLVLPWKYGFKSIKSIVKISFLAERPIGLWEKLAPNEYGFWANVNPKVSHPRWSQETEQQLGIDGRIPTVKYNGYEEQVSYLYKGLEKTLQDKLFR